MGTCGCGGGWRHLWLPLYFVAVLWALAAPHAVEGTSSRNERDLLLYNDLFRLPTLSFQSGGVKKQQPKPIEGSTESVGGGEGGGETWRLDGRACEATDGGTGLCYEDTEACERIGGLALSPCDHGRQKGVCCLVERSCRNVSSHPMSYFVNPSYPNQDTAASFCDFRVDITNENVCQLRLELEQFSLAAPHRHLGVCRSDRFVAMTTLPNGIGLAELCGDNHRQHFYVPVDATSVGSTSVSLMMMTSGAKPYHWRIRITQIDCKETPELVAPPGCLQYHTDMQGVLESFNYADGGGRYQANLDYAICIKRYPNTCRIVYSQPEDAVFYVNSAEGSDLPEGVGRAGTASCDLTTHDYLHLPGGRYEAAALSPHTNDHEEEDDDDEEEEDGSTSTVEKFCGKALSGLAASENVDRLRSGYTLDPMNNATTVSPVTSHAPGPIIVRFHTDSISEPGLETGFRIEYRQLATGCIRQFG